MRLPKRCKKNKPSKYVPKYDTIPTWEEMYKHCMHPYKIVIRQVTILTQETK